MKIASFDIFDTTLIRKCGSSQNVFYILSRKLFPDNVSLQTDFYIWRCSIENAIHNQIKHEISLKDIYQHLPVHLSASLSILEIVKQEKIIESNNLISNLNVKKEIQAKRRNGFVICFISDMYLDSDFLKDILIRESCAEESDRVFVSCEHQVTKRDNGALYDAVKQAFPEIDLWEHYGDNRHSDVKNAKKKGIHAHLIKTLFSNAEQYVLREFLDYSFYPELSVLIGFQRACRLNIGSNPDVENAADLIASFYLPYIHSMIDTINKYGITTLYFLSRDANILYEIAKIYFAYLLPNLHVRYLYVSRKALEPVFEEPIENEKKIVLLDYLKQEGFLNDNETIGVVDVGWLGSTRMMLNKLRGNSEGVTFLYLGYETGVIYSDKGRYIPFYPTPVDEFQIKYWIELIENYFSPASHMSTIGYERKDGYVVPVFDTNVNEDMSELARVNIVVCRTISNFLATFPFLNWNNAFFVWGMAFLKLFNEQPKRFRLETFKKVFYYDKKFLMRVPLINLIKYFVTGSTGLPCIDEFSIYYTWGIRVRRRYTLHTIVVLWQRFKKRILSN